MFAGLARSVSRWWWVVLIGWIALAVAIRAAAPRWDDVTNDGDFAYLPPAMTSVQGAQLLEAAFPEVLARSQVIFVLARRNGLLQSADYAVADHLVAQFQPDETGQGPILSVVGPRAEVIGEKLLSPAGPQGQSLLVLVQLRNEFMAIGNMEFMGRVHEVLDAVRANPAFPQGLELGLTGSAAVGSDMLFSAEESIRNTEWATILLVILILLAVYRAPGLIAVPMLTIVASLVVAMGAVAALAQWSEASNWLDFKIFTTTRIFVVVILFGAGTDFCLFLIARYKEELQRGLSSSAAVARALTNVSGAIAASAMTTILGLGAMAFADFGKFRYSGPAIALCLAVNLAASLTLAPALLRAGGRWVFWPFLSPSKSDRPQENADGLAHRFWSGLGRAILARPGLILVGSVLLMAPLAVQGGKIEVTYDFLSELQPDRPSVQGTRLLRRYFPAGETGPVTVLAYLEAGGLEDSGELREKLKQLSQLLYSLQYEQSDGTVVRPITGVRSLVEPLGEPPARFGFFDGVRKGILRGHQRTKDMYLAQSPQYAGRVTRLDLVTLYDPFSRESLRLLDALDDYFAEISQAPASAWQGTEFYYTGTTAGIRDLELVTTGDLSRIQQLVPLAVLIVLVVILRRPAVSIYLILTVLFGYFVSIGATDLLFRVLNGDAYHGLDWKVPVFLFVILIAVGQDYNIYLVTRVQEEQRRRGIVEGLRVGLLRTGGIITSCGVIMAGTFASMIFGTLQAVVQLGVALSLGVLLDTLVIRTVLVPAFLRIWDRWSPPRGVLVKPAGRDHIATLARWRNCGSKSRQAGA